jgi:hypothetical protein
MVVYDLHVVGVALFPTETDAPTIIDPDTMLALPSPFQSLQVVGWGDAHVLQCLGPIEHSQLPQSSALNVRPEPTHWLTIKKGFGVSGSKGPDHRFTL